MGDGTSGNRLRNVFGFDTPGIHLFPRQRADLFDISEDEELDEDKREKQKIASVKRNEALDKFEPYNNELSEHIKAREALIFDISKHITVCMIDIRPDGKYNTYINRPPNRQERYRHYYVKLSVENNNTGMEISIYRLEQNRYQKLTENDSISVYYGMGENLWKEIRIVVEGTRNQPDNDSESDEEKTFEIVAELIQRKNENGSGNKHNETRLKLTLSPYEGWTLTKGGDLKQGRTGWFFDEKRLYILEDGRRVNEETVKESKYREDEIKVGAYDAGEGFRKLLGAAENFSETICLQHKTEDLLKKYGPHMTEVVYQAFQINRGYKLLKEKGTVISNSFAWEPCTRYNPAYRNTTLEYIETPSDCSFGVIGKDETDIPIVVTRIGNENAQKKLVIAGPHGDERNAKRLIMAAQRHFIQNGAPADTVLYFVPCISPTMAFADARGIPVVDKDEVRSPVNQVLAEYKSGNKNIPYLHDLMTKRVTAYNLETNKEENNVLMRDAIQNTKYNESAFEKFDDYIKNKMNQNYPRYGIDANRDVGDMVIPWLESTKHFITFMSKLRGSLGAPDNIKVFMVHGYKAGGGVFGTYEIDLKEKKAKLLPEGEQMAYAFWDFLFGGKKEEFYGSTETLPHDFVGELNQILYKKFGIFSVDIELPSNPYDEGRRGDNSNIYRYDNVKYNFGADGILLGRKGFFELLKAYPDVINKYKPSSGTINQ